MTSNAHAVTEGHADERRRYRGAIPEDGPLEPLAGVEAFLRAMEAGEPWYPALLAVVARWTAPREVVDGVFFEYLVAGEAFDWLRLAQRLLEAAEEWLPEAVPEDESEALLFHGTAPDGSDEAAFALAIGPAKHRAHLNFQYGVVVEEALLLSAEQELQKANQLAGSRYAADIAAYERVYGKPLDELIETYREETDGDIVDGSSLGEWRAFTYWCSKYRFRLAEPARVASDTRKALALLSQIDRHRQALARERAARAMAAREAIDVGGRPLVESARMRPRRRESTFRASQHAPASDAGGPGDPSPTDDALEESPAAEEEE